MAKLGHDAVLDGEIVLDPHEAPFTLAVQAAPQVRKYLEKKCAECYCKSSGKRGLHIYVPLGGRYDFDVVKLFAQLIAETVHRQMPDVTSVVRSPKLRQGKVYLDYLQNRRGQSMAAPYSVRPVAGAPISTPLKWSEVTKRLDPRAFTMRTLSARLDRLGDLWKPVLGKGADLDKCLRGLQA